MTRRMRHTLWISGALLVAAAGWLGFSRLRVREVETVRPAEREVVELVIASGTLRAKRQSPIGSEVTGVIESVFVEDGDRVAAGASLVQLRRDDARQRLEQSRQAAQTAAAELALVRRGTTPEELARADAELDRATAARLQAERDFARRRALFDDQVVAQADLDLAASTRDQAAAAEAAARETLADLRARPRPEDLQVAEARLREAETAVLVAKQDLERRTIRAPLPGLVIRRSAEPGQSVTPGNALLELADLRVTEIYVETDENNLDRLRTGQRATVLAPAFRDQPFAATLAQIGPEVDSSRGVVGLRFTPDRLPDFVRPDMTVDVSVEVARLPRALSLPATALLQRDGRWHVLVVTGDTVREQPVRVLARGTEWIAVTDVPSDAAVLVRGTEAAAGDTVRPVARP
ncbi:MAG TPA: efflux RND transporter periplasmic adaptor subunit [Acidobacteriota bacterium]|nr:efflux RND transporter periplasmic adaptor subunit [Acidobacteriota bacterium]HQF87310.1 efflux RND transporter periplasmic adaptor subunit [Acidobacteriota bacterium]HQK87650.1 efflux RND transporter periplasmic adaptor subunit [Acidobacteriota bacterium]